MKLDLEQARIDTCYHEAAHAVFDYQAGLTIRYVYVTEKLNAMCVSAKPVNPYPWQALDEAVGLFAGEIAAYRRSGEQRPSMPFDEFVSIHTRQREIRHDDGRWRLLDDFPGALPVACLEHLERDPQVLGVHHPRIFVVLDDENCGA